MASRAIRRLLAAKRLYRHVRRYRVNAPNWHSSALVTRCVDSLQNTSIPHFAAAQSAIPFDELKRQRRAGAHVCTHWQLHTHDGATTDGSRHDDDCRPFCTTSTPWELPMIQANGGAQLLHHLFAAKGKSTPAFAPKRSLGSSGYWQESMTHLVILRSPFPVESTSQRSLMHLCTFKNKFNKHMAFEIIVGQCHSLTSCFIVDP